MGRAGVVAACCVALAALVVAAGALGARPVPLEHAPAAWVRRCRALATRPACPTVVQRSPVWRNAEAVRVQDVHRMYGTTSLLLYADARFNGDEPVCAQVFDGGKSDFSRITPACYTRFQPSRGLVAWVSIATGPVLGTVHHEWRTRARQPARLADGVAAHHGFVPLDFGPVTWDARAGRLLLGPRGFSEELVFVWGKGSAERAVGIQVFEPLTQAAATLQAIVASVPRT